MHNLHATNSLPLRLVFLGSFFLTIFLPTPSLRNMTTLAPKRKFLDRWTPRVVLEAKQIFREKGIKGVIRRFGWKFFAVFFIYYLIRDVTLYILLPWYLASKLV